MKLWLVGIALSMGASFLQAQNVAVYQDESAPLHDRVTDLLKRMTVEEKISLLRATSPEIPRLGIAKYYHGN
jgi:beta-glucosidase